MTRKVSAAYDTERAQAGVRMIFVAVAGCYTAALYHFSLIDPRWCGRSSCSKACSASWPR